MTELFKHSRLAPWLDRTIDKTHDRRFYCYVLMDPRRPGPFAYGDRIYPFEPFYIGKGVGYRLHAHFTQAMRFRKTGRKPNEQDKEIAKISRILEIIDSGFDEKTFKSLCAIKLIENLNEFEAFEHEADLIRTIGRYLIHMGPLLNEIEGTQFTGGYQRVALSGFTGMCNKVEEGEFAGSDGKTPRVTPRVILNADVDPGGCLTKRQGFRMLINLPGSHSLWACPRGLFAVAPDNDSTTTSSAPCLYRINGDRAIKICQIADDISANVFGIEYSDRIIFSTSRDIFYYDLESGFIEREFVATPPVPIAIAMAGVGSLPRGRYALCSTFTTRGNIGAPSQPVFVDVFEDGSGIEITNHDSLGAIWMTDCDGDTFFGTDERFTITHAPSVEPLQTFNCEQTPPLSFLVSAFGRLFGSDGPYLLYSEAYRYDLVRPGSFFKFDENITMIAPSFNGQGGGGLFVGLETRTIFLAGASVKDMVEKKSGLPPVLGSLVYCQNVPQLGNNIPVWATSDGLVAGGPDGSSINLHLDKARILPGARGASFFRMYKGSPQIVSSFARKRGGANVGFGDKVTCEVVRRGTVL